MNTPYPWTKQLAHLGGTRDGMIVRWGSGIAARGEVRHQWHHAIDVLPTILEAAGLPVPATFGGVAQQPLEGTSFRYSFDAPDAQDRRTTQYFEMIGNRAIYRDGWTAVTRHGTPWEMVETPERSFDEDVWELYDHAADWSQARDLAQQHPERLRDLQQVFDREAEKHHVLPLDDRVTERENPEVAGRLDLHGGRTSLSLGSRVGRLTEEAAPNVKNRSHVITADLEVVPGTDGVVVAPCRCATASKGSSTGSGSTWATSSAPGPSGGGSVRPWSTSDGLLLSLARRQSPASRAGAALACLREARTRGCRGDELPLVAHRLGDCLLGRVLGVGLLAAPTVGFGALVRVLPHTIPSCAHLANPCSTRHPNAVPSRRNGTRTGRAVG